MRGALPVLAALVTSACGARTYWVRPSHVPRARGDVALPALDRHNEPTYVRVETIDVVHPPDPTHGLAVAEVRDPRRGYRITGFVTAGVGGLYLAAPKDSPSASDAALAAPGVVLLGVGVFLVALSYALEGVETDGPTEGFPASVREP